MHNRAVQFHYMLNNFHLFKMVENHGTLIYVKIELYNNAYVVTFSPTLPSVYLTHPSPTYFKKISKMVLQICPHPLPTSHVKLYNPKDGQDLVSCILTKACLERTVLTVSRTGLTKDPKQESWNNGVLCNHSNHKYRGSYTCRKQRPGPNRKNRYTSFLFNSSTSNSALP